MIVKKEIAVADSAARKRAQIVHADYNIMVRDTIRIPIYQLEIILHRIFKGLPLHCLTIAKTKLVI